MSKFVKYLSIVLFGLSAVLAVLFYINPSESMVEIVLYYAYFLFGLAVLLAVTLPFISLLDNPKKFKRIFINIAVVVVVFGLGYLFASGGPLQGNSNMTPSAMELKLTDAGLIVTYLLLFLTIVAILSGGVINLIRNR